MENIKLYAYQIANILSNCLQHEGERLFAQPAAPSPPGYVMLQRPKADFLTHLGQKNEQLQNDLVYSHKPFSCCARKAYFGAWKEALKRSNASMDLVLLHWALVFLCSCINKCCRCSLIPSDKRVEKLKTDFPVSPMTALSGS